MTYCQLNKFSTDVTPWFSSEFKFKYLGLKIKLPDGVRIRYSLGKKPYFIGRAKQDYEDNKQFIKIINPSLYDVENYFNSTGLETIVLREHTCAHEEAHVLFFREIELLDRLLSSLTDTKIKSHLNYLGLSPKEVGYINEIAHSNVESNNKTKEQNISAAELFCDITGLLHTFNKFKEISGFKIYNKFLKDRFTLYKNYLKQ